MTATARVRYVVEAMAARWRVTGLLIFALALALRTVVAFWLPDGVAWADGYRYLRVAENLVGGRGFGGILDNWQSVPTQPLLLALFILVSGKSYLVFRLALAALGAASCVLGGALARRLFGPVAGVVAGVMLATYPTLIYTNALFEYPQTLFILLLAGMYLFMYRFFDSGRLIELLPCGVLAGCAALTVPTMLACLPLLVVCFWIVKGRAGVLASLVFALAAALPVGAWALRNHVAYGETILVNKAGSISLWMGNNETYYQYGKGSIMCGPGFEFSTYCRDNSQIADVILTRKLTDAAAVDLYDRTAKAKSREFISASPWRFVELTVRKFLLLWNPVPDAVTANEDNAPAQMEAVLAASYVPVLVLALASAFWLRRRWRGLAPLIAIGAGFAGVYSIILPVLRYRLPIDFLLVLFAACAVSKWLRGASVTDTGAHRQ